jgi:hypothetical protein
MPTTYELMEAYRTWWRTSYGTSPNSQAVILAAAWAEHVLSTYRAGEEACPPLPPTPTHTRGPMPNAYEFMSVYELSEAYARWWRTSYETSTNDQALDLAAAWAVLVLSACPAGEDATPPPEAAT